MIPTIQTALNSTIAGSPDTNTSTVSNTDTGTQTSNSVSTTASNPTTKAPAPPFSGGEIAGLVLGAVVGLTIVGGGIAAAIVLKKRANVKNRVDQKVVQITRITPPLVVNVDEELAKLEQRVVTESGDLPHLEEKVLTQSHQASTASFSHSFQIPDISNSFQFSDSPSAVPISYDANDDLLSSFADFEESEREFISDPSPSNEERLIQGVMRHEDSVLSLQSQNIEEEQRFLSSQSPSRAREHSDASSSLEASRKSLQRSMSDSKLSSSERLSHLSDVVSQVDSFFQVSRSASEISVSEASSSVESKAPVPPPKPKVAQSGVIEGSSKSASMSEEKVSSEAPKVKGKATGEEMGFFRSLFTFRGRFFLADTETPSQTYLKTLEALAKEIQAAGAQQ